MQACHKSRHLTHAWQEPGKLLVLPVGAMPLISTATLNLSHLASCQNAMPLEACACWPAADLAAPMLP